MALNADQLDAFFEVAHKRNFSVAAKSLGISQPALSHRVRKLEETLETTLLVRLPSGIELTETGRRLLIHCQTHRNLEGALLDELKLNDRSALAGLIRVAAFSTVMRSVILPILSKIVLEHPMVQLETASLELYELANRLKTGAADLVITSAAVTDFRVATILLGYEEYVAIESKRISPAHSDVYFDHDPEDTTTIQFMKAQSSKFQKLSIRRSFLDEIYSIIDAVELGWGRAVVPLHLVRENTKIRVLKSFGVMKSPVYLSFPELPFYPPLHTQVLERLKSEAPKSLAK